MGLPKGRTNNPNGRPKLPRAYKNTQRLNCYMPGRLFGMLTHFAREEEISLPGAARRILTEFFANDHE